MSTRRRGAIEDKPAHETERNGDDTQPREARTRRTPAKYENNTLQFSTPRKSVTGDKSNKATPQSNGYATRNAGARTPKRDENNNKDLVQRALQVRLTQRS